MSRDRIDLYVSPEEYAAVRALGARWDGQLKCWYLDAGTPLRRFARWLGEAPDTLDRPDEPDAPDAPDAPGPPDTPDACPGGPFAIQSHRAYVASAAVPCCRCRRLTEVICIYCCSGTAWAEPLEHFTLQHVCAVDAGLARQLERWPWFRLDERCGAYVNRCTHCNAIQPDADLHSEPDQPFYDLGGTAAVTLTALRGPIRLDADYSVEV